jgi:hypothetical protein
MNGNTYAFLTNSNIAIAGTGTFANGLLGTGVYRVDFLAGSASAGGSNNSYIAGLARKIGNTPFIFPIGASGYYAGIGFSPSGTTSLTDHFTASYTRVVPNPYNITQKEASIDHVGNCEYWMFDRTNGSQSATVSLHFDDTRSCGVDNLSQLIVCRWNGTQWTNGGNGGVAGSFVQSSTTFTAFSPFTLGSTGVNNPLPVGLVSFKAKGVESNALISWETSFELNTKNFVVERSLNGKDFEAITTQDALGRANTYQFIDRGIGVKFMQVYYRLKSVDTDGKYTYSPIEVVNFGEKQFTLIAIQPNPIQKDFAIVYDMPANGKVQICITDALGKLVDKQIVEAEAGRNQYPYGNIDHLVNGIYVLSLQYEGQTISKKIVK